MEDKDIELIEEFNYNFLSATRIGLDFPVTMYIKDDTHNSIMKLLQAYKQDEKVIDKTSKYIENDSRFTLSPVARKVKEDLLKILKRN